MYSDPRAHINMRYKVAIRQWSANDGLADVIEDELQALGHQTTRFSAFTEIPRDAQVVFSFGPYGDFLDLPLYLHRTFGEKSPAFVHWNTEGFPDLRIPWNTMMLVSAWRSWFGRFSIEQDGSRRTLARRWLISAFRSHMLRFRYLGDYYHAHRHGLMDVFADSSAIYAQLHNQAGLHTLVAPWGATRRWYADLEMERDIDVLWLGKRGTSRRGRLMDRVFHELESRGVKMHIADGVHNPFIFEKERTHFLNRSKITLNLMRTWYDDNFSRFAMAAPNRSLIVSEPILPHCPAYQPGVHYVSVPVDRISDTILYYLSCPQERQEITERAYILSTTEITFNASIGTIMEAASQVCRKH